MSEAAEYCQITLEPKLASTAAQGLYGALKQHRGAEVVVDASRVEQLGILCMQILVSARKSWADDEMGFQVVEPSEAFRKSAEAVGLDLALMGVEQTGENS